MDVARIFGSNLKRCRHEKGLSQERLAELSGLHRTYISDIEGFRRNVSLRTVQRIADALEVEPYTLLREDP